MIHFMFRKEIDMKEKISESLLLSLIYPENFIVIILEDFDS